jgi:hypothetical protein
MQVVSYLCEVCKKPKGETNHWFGIRLHRELHSIVIFAFSQIPDDQMEQFEHVCGPGCLSKRVDMMAVAL